MKRKLLLDPSLHVIEKEDSLLLTTRNKHVKIPVNQTQIKEKIFRLFEYIDQGVDYNELIDQKIYNKLVDQLIGLGIILADDVKINSDRELHHDVRFIHGDSKVLSFLHSMIENSRVISSNCLEIIFDRSDGRNSNELFCWLNHNFLYITIDQGYKEKTRDHRLNDLAAQYVAHTIREFMYRNEFISPNVVYRYELSKPTSPVTVLHKTIDLDNLHSYMEYLIFDESEGEMIVRRESETFFPFHCLNAMHKTTGKQFYGIGRNELEALRNLIFVIHQYEEADSFSIVGLGRNDDMTESELLFLKKIINLYTHKEVKIIEYHPNAIHYELAELCVRLQGCGKVQYSWVYFLLSMYMTAMEMGEGDVKKTIILDIQQLERKKEGDLVG